MKVNRLAFVEALNKVMPGIEKEAILLEGANSFMFDEDWIKTFNDSISVSYPFRTGVKCLIKAEEFFKVLSKLEVDEVEMEVNDNKLVLKAGNTRIKMVMMKEDLFLLGDSLFREDNKWFALSDKFKEALRSCVMVSTSDQMYSNLWGVSIGKDGLISSDNFRAAWYHLNMEEEFVLPVNAAKELARIEDLIEYSQNEAWVHFHNKKGLCFSTRKINNNFPRNDIKGLLDSSKFSDEDLYIFPKGMVKLVERVSIFASPLQDREDEYIQIQLDEEGNLLIKGLREFGEIEDKIPPDGIWKFPVDFILTINPKYLWSMLSVGNEFYLSENNLILIKGANFDGAISLVML